MIYRSYLTVSMLLLMVLIFFSACGGTTQRTNTALPSKTTAPSLDPKIIVYSASVRIQTHQPTPVSASCKSGEQMIGGGFVASNLFEYAAAVDASYPSSPTTWTAAGSETASYFDLSVEVYCASAPIPLGVQIVQGSGDHLDCPQGAKVLSGGFQNSQPVAASYPLSNGWMSPASEQIYALCASQHVQSSTIITATFNIHSPSQGYQPGGGSASCPTGQVATGGGFDSHGDVILGSSLGVPPSAGWSVGAGGNSDVVVYALCNVLG
jgi:hypothetical protein